MLGCTGCLQHYHFIPERGTDGADVASNPDSSLDGFFYDGNRQCECLLGTVPGVVYSLDKEGEFTYVSDNVESTFGFTQEDLVGHHFSSIIHPSDIHSVSREHILPRFEGVPTGNERAPKLFDERRSWPRKTNNLEVRVYPKKGFSEKKPQIMVCKVNAAGHYDQIKQFCGTIGIMYNAFEEDEMPSLLSRKQQYNAFELLTQALSHVFSNVFTGIYGNLQLIEMQLEESYDIGDNIEAIKHSVENAVTLIRKLSKIVSTQGKNNGNGLHTILNDTAEELLGGAGLEYHCEKGSNLWLVESDPDYIRHVVRAVYFHIAQLVAQQGPVKICASNVHEAPIRLPRIDCAYVMIGIEFPPLLEVEPTSKIDQFFSLERIAAMSLSYELLKKIGGLLSVTTVNHLSSVQLYLPAIRS